MTFWIIYILVQTSFLGLLLGVLASAFFKFSWLANHDGQHFYSLRSPALPPTTTTTTTTSIKKLPTALWLLNNLKLKT